MNKRLTIFLLLFITCGCGLQAEPQEIVVKVATESKLKPLYLTPAKCETKIFDAAYIKKLGEILRFDLHHNGSSFVTKPNMELQVQDKKESIGGFEHEFWSRFGINYVVKPSVLDSKFSVVLYMVGVKDWTGGYSFDLTGDLKKDRKGMHRLSDEIHLSFFGVKGIASTRILYTLRSRNKSSNSSKWTSEVWESDYDGANAEQITYDGSSSVTPVYLPPKPGHGSGNFFYVSYKMGQPKIFMGSLKGGATQRFSYLRGNQFMPAISQQRDRVAFVCDASGRVDLFLQAFDPKVGCIGKPKQIFSAYKSAQSSPTFSPDGKKIAFVSNKDGSPRVYVMDTPSLYGPTEKPKVTFFTKQNRENTCPTWSPDGKKIAYSAKVNGIRQIWVYNFETKEEKPLTSGPGNKENPTWAANSKHIIFNTADENSCELYLSNLNQSEIVKIISDGGEKRFPSWELRTR